MSANKNIAQLIKELNDLLNLLVQENPDLKCVIRQIHSLGFHVQISFNAGTGEAGAVAHTGQCEAATDATIQLDLNRDDYLFLKSIKISIDT